jgi:ParB family chromosome partitioning protein
LVPIKKKRNKPTPGDEWRTPPEYIEAARAVLGEIDLDPASNASANRVVRAKTFYDKQTNGLDKEWWGRVWLNPPYSRELILKFTEKLVEEYNAGRCTAAIVLGNAMADAKWFEQLSVEADALCFTARRIKFLDQHGRSQKTDVRGQVFIYLGGKPVDNLRVNDIELFDDYFCEFGTVWLPSSQLVLPGLRPKQPTHK